MSGDDDLRAPFQRWLAQRQPEMEQLEVGEMELPKSGFSAKTIFVPIRYVRNGQRVDERLVLRIENPEPALYPQQAPGLDVEIEIQYRAMEALAKTGKIPLAELIGYEADASILGQPFFVMGFMGGDVMIENPPYTQAGFFFEAEPAERERIIRSAVGSLAAFHTIELGDADFSWLVPEGAEPTVLRQVELWQDVAERALEGRDHTDLARAFLFLRDHAPRDLEPALSWGDARPGNIIFRGGESLCLTDFENLAVAPREIDLGYWLMFDRTMHESVSTERLPGELSRDEQRALYAELAGIPVPETYYFEVLGAARYATIVVPVMNRLVSRGLLPADHTIWYQNPAAAALGALLKESAGG